jgi:hypothetical protein
MRRNRKLIIAGAAATAMVAGTGAGVAIAGSSAGNHILKFNSVGTSQQNFGSHFVDSDKDIKNGKRIGSDVAVGIYHQKTQTITVSLAVGLKGGFIYGTGSASVAPNSAAKFTGTVTGGTGVYKGITGTLTGTAYGHNDDNEHIKIVYKN